MPYINEKGVRDVYEITQMRTITGREAKQQDGEEYKEENDKKAENDIRLASELRFVRRQYANYQRIDTSKMANYTFIDTTLEELPSLEITDRV